MFRKGVAKVTPFLSNILDQRIAALESNTGLG